MATSDTYVPGNDEEGPGDTTNCCPDCDSRIRTDAVEIVCEGCGLVLEETPIDHGPEWRMFADDQTDRNRTGAPITPTRHDRGLSTEIGHKRDAKGNTLSTKKRAQLGRLRREHNRGRWQSKADRNLGHGLTEIRRISCALGMPESIRDRACVLFRSAQEEDLLPGRSIEAMTVASVYAACRCNNLPWTINGVCDVSRVSRDRIENAYQVLNRELGLPAVPPTPGQYVPRLASDLDLSDETRRSAERIATETVDRGLANGRNPAGVAAACLYEATREHGEEVTQQELGDAADVTPMTVRAGWEEIRELSIQS